MLQSGKFVIKNMEYSILRESPLFRTIGENDINKMLSVIPYQIRKYKAGSIIAQSGEPITSLLIILNGSAKGEMVDFAGRVIKIEDIPAPGALAAAFLFGTNNRFPVNVIATSDSEILRIDKHDFITILKSEERLMINFLNMISNRSQFLSEKIRFLNFKTLKVKLAQYILQKAGNDGTIVILDMTQNEFADFFGVARPSVARALNEMEERGIILAERKKITIINRKELSEMISD
jgi:CRP/FNR family transcriptional regulator, dissimilatory nitrate respiration regulator